MRETWPRGGQCSSSHILSEVERTCDRVAIIRDGRLRRSTAWKGSGPPTPVEIRFVGPVPTAEFERLPVGQEVTTDDYLMRLRVSGSITPVLRAAASHDLVDLCQPRAGLKRPSRPSGRKKETEKQKGKEAVLASDRRARTLAGTRRAAAGVAVEPAVRLGSVYEIASRSRLAIVIMAGLLSSFVLSAGADYGKTYATQSPG
jgi:hypothetical protein